MGVLTGGTEKCGAWTGLLFTLRAITCARPAPAARSAPCSTSARMPCPTGSGAAPCRCDMFKKTSASVARPTPTSKPTPTRRPACDPLGGADELPAVPGDAGGTSAAKVAQDAPARLSGSAGVDVFLRNGLSLWSRFSFSILVLSVNAIHLARSPAPEAHAHSASQFEAQHACDRERGGGAASSRPPTCGWEAPFDRLGNRSSASQRTRLCVGRGGLIGVSLLSDPTSHARAGHSAIR